MKKLGLLMIILAILTLNLFGQDDAKLQQFLEQAKQRKTEAGDFANKGEFAKAAESYTEALKPFLTLTDPKEIALAEETMAILYTLRGMVYLGAKDDEKGYPDFQKRMGFYLNRAKRNFEKSKTMANLSDAEAVKLYDSIVDDLRTITAVETRYASTYRTVFKTYPAKNLTTYEQELEIGKILDQVFFSWGKAETAIFLQTNNTLNAEKALEMLSRSIGKKINDIEAYKLRESIYRKRGNKELADADLAKIKSLQK